MGEAEQIRQLLDRTADLVKTLESVRDQLLSQEKPETTEIAVLVDRSASMRAIAEELTASYGHWMREQAAQPGQCVVSLAYFDAPGIAMEGPGVCDLDIAYQGVLAADAALDLKPRGMTPLWDAIVRFQEELCAPREALPAAHRFAVILTDGLENASRVSGAQAASKAIEAMQRKWNVIYLGANQDAILEAGKLNIPSHNTMTYTATAGGTRATMASVSSNMRQTRTQAPGTEFQAFNEQQRAEAVEEDAEESR